MRSNIKPMQNLNLVQTIYLGVKKWYISLTIVFIGTLLASLTFIKRLPYVYHSTFKISTINLPAPSIAPSSDGSNANQPPLKLREDQIWKILLSKTFTSSILNEVFPNKNKLTPAFVDQFMKNNVFVQRESRGKLISLTVKYMDPDVPYQFCNLAMEKLINQISQEDRQSAEIQSKIFSTYLKDNLQNQMDIQNLLYSSQFNDPKFRKKYYDSVQFIQASFNPNDFTELSSSTLRKILEQRLKSIEELGDSIIQNYQLLSLDSSVSSTTPTLQNQSYFEIVDAPEKINSPDSPDKKLLILIAFIVSLSTVICFIYLRFYIESSIKQMNH